MENTMAKMLGYSNPHDAVNRHCKTPGCVFYEVGVQKILKLLKASSE